MRNTLIALGTAGLLVACGAPDVGTGPTPLGASQLETHRRGADVTGRTGPGWTEAELREGLQAATICNDNYQVRNLEITRAPSGALIFKGVCAR